MMITITAIATPTIAPAIAPAGLLLLLLLLLPPVPDSPEANIKTQLINKATSE